MIFPPRHNHAVNQKKVDLSTSTIGHSGNSDVDVSVNVDTMPVALSILGVALANGQLTQPQYQSAVQELFDATDRYQSTQTNIR